MFEKFVRCLITVPLIFLLFTNQNKAMAAINEIDKKIQQIESEIKYNMETHNIPGMSYTLVDPKGVVYSKGFGTLDIRDETKKIDKNTNFNLGSLSKVFTSIAILKLQEKGVLAIDDPVVTYLPWFKTKDTDLSKKVTIKHLLNHSSGLPGRLNVHDIKSENRDDIIKEISHKLSNVDLVSEPGNTFEYTNMNSDLLQLLIEEVSGEAFTEYMKKNIFEPLGMERTGYFTFNGVSLPNTAMGHRYHWGKIKPYQEELVYATSSSAGLSSNGADLAKFMLFLLNEGQTSNGTLVKPESIIQMFQANSYGIGFNWYIYPHNVYMEGGLPGFTSNMVLSADKSFGLVLLSNSNQEITYHSAFNLFRIVNGGTPRVLLAKDFPKVKMDVKIILGITIFVGILLTYVVVSTIFQLVKGIKKISFMTPSIGKIIIIGLSLTLYIGVMYYIYIIVPYKIGVPSLYEYKKEPNLTSVLFILTVSHSAFTIIVCLKQLMIQSISQIKMHKDIKL